MSLYQLRSLPSGYRILKFTDDYDFVGAYECTDRSCNCPASRRPSCRHREMVPEFEAAGKVDTGEFFDYEAGAWLDALEEVDETS